MVSEPFIPRIGHMAVEIRLYVAGMRHPPAVVACSGREHRQVPHATALRVRAQPPRSCASTLGSVFTPQCSTYFPSRSRTMSMTSMATA